MCRQSVLYKRDPRKDSGAQHESGRLTVVICEVDEADELLGCANGLLLVRMSAFVPARCTTSS